MAIIKDIEKRQVIFLLLVFMVGCLLAVSPVAAIHGVSVNLEQPGGPCTPADKCIIFTIDKGMNQNINAFLVSFPDGEVDVPGTINSSCVNISWNNGTWTTPVHPNVDVQVFHGAVPGHPTPPGTTTIKIWTPVSIPSNKQVEICFLPCSGITLSGCNFTAWVSSDLEPYDPAKDSDFKSTNVEHPEYTITAIQSQGGFISPSGTVLYECGDTPTYYITADECYVICDVCVEAEEGSHDPCFDRTTQYIPGVGQYIFIDSQHAEFTFDPLHGCGEITAKFAKDPSCYHVNVFLKYQNSLENCGDILNVGNCTDPCLCQAIFSSQSISDAVNFTDDLYIGGNSSVFYLNSTNNALPDNPSPHADYGHFSGGAWIDATPVGEPVNVTVTAYSETEIFQATVNLNDGSQITTDPIVISGFLPAFPLTQSSVPIPNVVNVVNVVGINAGPTCGYQDAFSIDSTRYDEHYGDYSGGQWNDDEALGEPVEVNITSPPFPNPETYLVTYVGDDATPSNNATLVILTDGSVWWAPQNDNIGPTNIVDILNVTPQRPAWNLHTSCWIADHPEFEGLIGALIVVNNGTYHETFEMDTPGVVLKSKYKGGAVIDAFGIPPAFNATEFPGGRHGAVFITAGCTEINGFVIKNAGHCNGGAPDIDGNGFLDTAGIVVHPSSWKCNMTLIDGTFPCHDGRVNIINNTIWNSTAEGILANDTVVLVEGNDVYQNCWDGFAGEELHCGVECIDPFAITHCFDVVTEILFNKFHDNGCGKMSTWEGKDCKNTSRTSFSTAFLDPPVNGTPFWIDSGIEIRSVLCCKDNIDSEDGLVWNEEEPSLVSSDPFIIGNKIFNNTHAGINLLGAAIPEGNCENITIVENEIKGNGVFGISNFADEAKDHLIIKYNDISGNKWWGIKNFVETDDPNDIIIAKENWWGKIGGPSKGPAPICHEKDQRSIALGNGDAVSEFVEYNPWLTQPFCIVLKNDPVRWYGSDTLELDEGWNTLSVPLTLDDRADNITEISNLGWFLTPDNFVIAYQFNATSHLFEPINPYLIPCRGYYIKVKDHTRFPVLYSGSESPGLPSFALAPGWNLVGSAFGIDKKDNKYDPFDEGRWAVANPDSYPRDPESFMSAEEALDSLMSISPRGLSTVISPSVPGQIKAWALTADDLKKEDMYVGEGYWVFMVNPGTLSGFEITPFHFEYELELPNQI